MGKMDGGHRGIATVDARRILVEVAERCLGSIAGEHRAVSLTVLARQELRRNLGSVGAVVTLLTGYSLSDDRRATTLALALLVLCSLLTGVLIKVVCHRCNTFELQDRVSEACEAFTQISPGKEGNVAGATDAPLRQPWGASVGLQQGSALASVVSVYRNDLWQRVPKLLLVEGDVVALMGGDRAPCTAEVLRFKVDGDSTAEGTSTETSARSGAASPRNLPWVFYETGTKVLGDQHIDLRPEASEHFNRKTMVSATSPALLLLCGDMQCYRLLETPLHAHLKRSLSPAGTTRRTSLVRERVRAASKRCYSAVLIVALLAAAVGGVRLGLAEGSRKEWALYLLVIPSQVAVCLLPMSLPIYLAAGEAVATARLLAFLELILRRKREMKGIGDEMKGIGDEFDQMDAEEREEATSGTSHTVSWRKARAYLGAIVAARWQSGTRSRACRHVRSATPTPVASPANRGPIDVEVGVERTASEIRTAEAISGCETAGTSAFGKRHAAASPPWWRCLYLSLKAGCQKWRRGAGSGLSGHDDIVFDRESEEANDCKPDLKQPQQRRQTFLPVPMLGCGLVERLGAVTTLCMLDEDTVCQPTSVIKEVFLVDAKDDAGGGSGTVLDMHTQQGKKGVRFEDPHWWTHLPALKPIGLTCLLAEFKNSERQQTKAKSSPLPRGGVASSPVSQPGRALLDHVRDNQPLEHLTDLWKAIGFCAADRAMFRERRRIHVINPKLAAERATEDTHAQGQDESRRRGTIQPHLTSVMAEDRRSDTLQLLSEGNPSIVLGMCRDYWDGSAISNLPATLRKSILDMHQQWSLEDLDVVAFAYTPVPYTVTPFLSSFSKHPDYLIHTAQSSGKGRSRGSVLSPASLPRRNATERSKPEAHTTTSGKGGAGSERTGPAVSPQPEVVCILGAEGHASGRQNLSADSSPVSASRIARKGSKLTETQSGDRSPEAGGAPGLLSKPRGLTRGASEGCLDMQGAIAKDTPDSRLGQQKKGVEGGSADRITRGGVLEDDESSEAPRKRAVKFRPRSSHNSPRQTDEKGDPTFARGEASKAGLRLLVGSSKKGGRRYSMDDYGVNIAHRVELQTSQGTMVPASGESKMAEALWNLMHEQVFLGMAASFVPPKRDIVALIEDVEAAGVRFVYFSPRNMRRSKALAESMGIETDWNCAISLRPLEDSSQPDPHRMTSSYADWDVKARLPHGIASIRDHIERVDNVPLLVSLFTDATPPTTRDMLGIYQENDESVLAVGMSHRAVNADLFRAADLSFSVESLPLNQPLSSLPVAAASCFSAIDAAFNSSIVGLHTALPLGDLVRRGGATGGLDEVGSIIIDLIREGRRLLTNTYQALSFLLLGSFTVALLVLVAATLPISDPMILGGDHLIWILWLVAPLLATSFLASPADGSLMKRTPEKNDPKVVPIAARLVVHLLLRTIPTVLTCSGLYVVLLGELLIIGDAELASNCGESTDANWMDVVWCLVRDDADASKTRAAAGQAVDLVLVELVLCLIAQSASVMYRTASIRKEHPWKNWVWSYAVVVIVFLQVLHLWASAAARQTIHLLSNCPWEPLVVGALCPLVTLVIAELLKRDGARAYDRYITLLRLEFDTRLGMHSPR